MISQFWSHVYLQWKKSEGDWVLGTTHHREETKLNTNLNKVRYSDQSFISWKLLFVFLRGMIGWQSAEKGNEGQ